MNRKRIVMEMRQKRCRLFLLISFLVFLFSILILLTGGIGEYMQIQTDFADNRFRAKQELLANAIFALIILIPGIALELSFIRSVYKMLKHEPKGIIKACYITSALLALFLVVFLCLIFARMAFFPKVGGENNTLDLLILMGWPSFLLSFILGSIPIKHSKSRSKRR